MRGCRPSLAVCREQRNRVSPSVARSSYSLIKSKVREESVSVHSHLLLSYFSLPRDAVCVIKCYALSVKPGAKSSSPTLLTTAEEGCFGGENKAGG